MRKNISELGPREAEFVSLFASRPKKIFSIQEANEYWKNQWITRKKLSQLEKKGWIARIERGKYLVVPLEAGTERKWSESPYHIADNLAQPACIGYWSAVRFWNWTEQIPYIYYVQTTQRKSSIRKTIFGIQYEIVTIPVRKYFGVMKQWEEGNSFYVSNKEKTLIDCADDVKRSGGIRELSKAVREAANEIDFLKLDNYMNRIGNGAARKRLGFLFEEMVPSLSKEGKKILSQWQKNLTTGINPLLPGGRSQGRILSRWSLRINTEI